MLPAVSSTWNTDQFLASMGQTDRPLHDRIRLLEAVVDHFPGGLQIFDNDLRLVLCNAKQRELLDYPDALFAYGNPSLEQIFRFNAERGEYGPGNIEDIVKSRLELVAEKRAHTFERTRPNGTVLEIRGVPLPGGGFLSTYLDVTEQRKSQSLIAHLAHHDHLTDLPNRPLMLDRLQLALASVRRGRKLALHFLDLDKFKPINDKHGHAIGDQVLKTVAGRLLKTVRDTDTVARIGGDEFVIIQVDVERASDVEMVARRMISAVSKANLVDGLDISVAVSVGVALAPWDGGDPDELLRKADEALYRSKCLGGGAVSFYSPPPVTSETQASVWMRDLN